MAQVSTKGRASAAPLPRAGQIAPNYALPPYDYQNGDLDKIPPLCVMREWLRVERTQMNLAPMTAVAYIKRPIPQGPSRFQDFDTYAPGAELRIVKVVVVYKWAKDPEDAAVRADGSIDWRGAKMTAGQISARSERCARAATLRSRRRSWLWATR